MCNCDVPRNKNGWPVVDPRYFTELQLRREAEKWRPTARQTDSFTVAYAEWHRYATELWQRGFTEKPDLDVELGESESSRGTSNRISHGTAQKKET